MAEIAPKRRSHRHILNLLLVILAWDQMDLTKEIRFKRHGPWRHLRWRST
jgi:hypothetical protein